MRDRQAGFTLLELLVTITVVAILAAVVMPSFVRENRKSRATSEVPPMFNDLRVRLEQYVQENGHYPATIGEGTMYPAGAPSTTRQSLATLPAEWQAIKVRLSGPDSVYCAYTWATGLANDGTNIGTQAGVFHFTAPPNDWYYLLAKCDMDGDNTVFSWYFSSSTDPTILKLNEGS